MASYQYKNDLIFPEDPCPEDPDYSYPPRLLLKKILNHNSAVDGVGSIYVSSAKYCKEKREAQHEFLVFSLKDNTSDRENTIIIDRVPQLELQAKSETPPTGSNHLDTAQENAELLGILATDRTSLELKIPSVTSRPGGTVMSSTNPYDALASSTSKSEPYPASDKCRVSATCNSDFVAFTKRQRLYPFTSNTLTNHKPQYNLINAQCYWYALSLWELSQRKEIHGCEVDRTASTTLPATHPYAPGLEAQFRKDQYHEDLNSILKDYKEPWKEFELKLPEYTSQSVKTLRRGHSNVPVVQTSPRRG